MKKGSQVSEVVLGLVVVAAIAAAFLAVRQRQAPGDGAAAAELPDVSRADATLDLGDVRITVSAGPRPLLAFSRNRFRFRAERGGAPVALEDGVVSFTMTMPMGDHRHALVPAADGWQEAEAALPLCPSGNRRWFGQLEFTLDGRARSTRFAFDLDAPSPRGSAATEDPRSGPRGSAATEDPRSGPRGSAATEDPRSGPRGSAATQDPRDGPRGTGAEAPPGRS